MTPKDKAKELVDKFTLVGLQQRNEGIQCALIAVDEIMQNVYDDRATIGRLNLTDKEFWQEVKKEIELIGK